MASHAGCAKCSGRGSWKRSTPSTVDPVNATGATLVTPVVALSWLFTMVGWTGWSDSLRGVAVGVAGARMAWWAGLTHGSSDDARGWLSFIRRVDRPGS